MPASQKERLFPMTRRLLKIYVYHFITCFLMILTVGFAHSFIKGMSEPYLIWIPHLRCTCVLFFLTFWGILYFSPNRIQKDGHTLKYTLTYHCYVIVLKCRWSYQNNIPWRSGLPPYACKVYSGWFINVRTILDALVTDKIQNND